MLVKFSRSNVALHYFNPFTFDI